MIKKETKNNKQRRKCEICSYDVTIDLHHQKHNDGSVTEHYLCPNHHCLITRRVFSLSEMMELKRRFKDEMTEFDILLSTIKYEKGL